MRQHEIASRIEIFVIAITDSQGALIFACQNGDARNPLDIGIKTADRPSKDQIGARTNQRSSRCSHAKYPSSSGGPDTTPGKPAVGLARPSSAVNLSSRG